MTSSTARPCSRFKATVIRMSRSTMSTDPAHPVFLADGDNAVAPQVNGNGTGSVTWGPTVNNGDGSFSATLYAMSTNQGIQAFTFKLSPSAAAVAGDYNHNGVVDAADYVLWRDTLGQSVTAGTGADGNGDGTVNPGRLRLLARAFRQHLGQRIGSLASANVPEPASLVGVLHRIRHRLDARAVVAARNETNLTWRCLSKRKCRHD